MSFHVSVVKKVVLEKKVKFYMSELRQRLDSGEWVIMAPERLKGKTLSKVSNLAHDTLPVHDQNCPFCIGNDDRFDNVEIDRINCAVTNDWTVRCLENKFQIFSNHDLLPPEPREFVKDGIYNKFSRYGNHELVIESAEHNKTLGNMTHDEVSNVVEMYYKRYKALNNDINTHTIIFKNHGPMSGASQKHPHSQIVSMMVVPEHTRSLINGAIEYYDRHGRCVFCTIIEHEQKVNDRVIYQNDKFIALTPYASSVPYEIEIYPKKHEADFSVMHGEDIIEFSDCLRIVMRKLYKALSNPDYNIIFRNPPYHLSKVLYYHWHLKIVPYLITPGGFELGTAMGVNILTPEEAAETLRNIDID